MELQSRRCEYYDYWVLITLKMFIICGSFYRKCFEYGVSIVLLLFWTENGSAVPITTNEAALKYLSTFGWLDPISSSTSSESIIDIRKAVGEFQEFAGLRVTGELDRDTLETMSLPRCGMSDKIETDPKSRRRKRYALQGYRWKLRNQTLTYKISKYPSRVEFLGRERVDAEIEAAFALWQNEANITFIRKPTGNVAIEIRFEHGAHGDGNPFDGKNKILAHAFYPRYGGDVHFDDDEEWTIESYGGYNLLQVAAHEFGHSLGMRHSKVRDSLMAPIYRGYIPDLQLHLDDIAAIQKLYHNRTLPVHTTTQAPPTQPSTLPTTNLPTGNPSKGANKQVRELLLKLLEEFKRKHALKKPQPNTVPTTERVLQETGEEMSESVEWAPEQPSSEELSLEQPDSDDWW